MTAAGKPSGRTIAALLCLTWAVAYLTRYRYLIAFGGLEPDYITWAMQNYFGGLTGDFEATANAILQLDWGKGGQMYPPTYPALLAILKVAGGYDLQTARFLQIGVDSLGVLIVYAIARRLGCQAGVSMLAAMVYAVVPWWAWGSNFILADSIMPLLVLGLVLLALRARDGGRPVDWLYLGLMASATTLARSEFGLFCLAIPILAAIGAPGKRLRLMAAGMAGFWLPWLAVSTLNYHTFGHFFPALNATFYALFAGLGQVPNDLGYFVDDARAIELLSGMGIAYHSPESEAYWRGVYLNAWIEHPAHVIRTILHRFGIILFHQEYTNIPSIHVPSYHRLYLLAAAATAILLYRRRLYDALVVAGPLLFALGTLGIIYVERRYVRYASLTYLFSAAIVLSATLGWLESRVGDGYRTVRRLAGGASFVIGYAGLAAIGLIPVDAEARRVVQAANPQPFADMAMQPVQNLRRVVEGALITTDGVVTKISSSPTILGYQAGAELDTAHAALLRFDFDIETPADGQWYLGILNSDQTAFRIQIALQPDRRTVDHRIIRTQGDDRLTVILTAETPSTALTIHRLEAAKICGQHDFSMSWLLFPHTSNLPELKVGPCPVGQDRQWWKLIWF